jgi:hypothetical protein
MFTSTGTLQYREGAIVLETDPEISRFYYTLLTKTLLGNFNKPRYAPHITIVNKKENIPAPIGNFGGTLISFEYLPDIQYHNGYYFLPVKTNPEFVSIRQLYNLGRCYDLEKGYHITVANILNKEKI